MYPEQLHPATEPSALLWGGAGEGEASAGVVVATDPASADADGDNGTVLHNSARSRKRNERANGAQIRDKGVE
jgi:hypothetical protein